MSPSIPHANTRGPNKDRHAFASIYLWLHLWVQLLVRNATSIHMWGCLHLHLRLHLLIHLFLQIRRFLVVLRLMPHRWLAVGLPLNQRQIQFEDLPVLPDLPKKW
jgi:hypothetical protein